MNTSRSPHDVFDTLLEETIGQRSPPDLAPSILAKLSQLEQGLEIDSDEDRERDAAVEAAQQDIRSMGIGSPLDFLNEVAAAARSNPTNAARHPVRRAPSSTSNPSVDRQRYAMLIGLALAAATIVAGYSLWPTSKSSMEGSDRQADRSSLESSNLPNGMKPEGVDPDIWDIARQPTPDNPELDSTSRVAENHALESSDTLPNQSSVAATRSPPNSATLSNSAPSAATPNSSLTGSSGRSARLETMAETTPETMSDKTLGIESALAADQIATDGRSDIQSSAADRTRRPSADQPRPFERLESNSIVNAIDEQFVAMWDRLGVGRNRPNATDSEWLERATLAALGRRPTADELAMVNANASPINRLAIANRLVADIDFSSTWANRFSKAWFEKDLQPNRRETDEVYLNWLTVQIDQGVGLDAIQTQMLAARGSVESGAEDFEPASQWLMTAKSRGPKFSEQFCRVMLGQNLSCARCHGPSRRRSLTNASVDTYWGIVSATDIFEIRTRSDGTERVRHVSDRAPKDRFYERADGTMALASRTLPDGTTLDTLRDRSDSEPLYAWFRTSQLRREKAVDVVWQGVFGRPLVPDFGLSDDEGAQERTELREFLAGQFAADSERLPSLVAWLVASSAMMRPTLDIPAETYLDASPDELAEWAVAKRTFAVFDTNAAQRSLTVADSIFASLAILEARPDSIANRTEVLAQPSIVPPGLSRSTTNADLDATAEARRKSNQAIRFIASSQTLPHKIEEQLMLWKSDELSWEQSLHHACWLTGYGELDEQMKSVAARFLAESGRDESTALRRLLTAMLSTNAVH
jgi:hypothetical protein